jgi:hypothetical protein
MARVNEFSIRVEGRPPPKSEAKSVFALGGKYEDRVRALLEATAVRMHQLGFNGFGDARLRMEVELHTGPGEPPWDATNYLGGITDVLESKTRRKLAQPGPSIILVSSAKSVCMTMTVRSRRSRIAKLRIRQRCTL